MARINPLRWIKGDAPPLEDVLKTMRERVAKFNIEKIKPQDLAGAAGPPDEERIGEKTAMTTSSASENMRGLGQRVTSLRSPSPRSPSVRAHWSTWAA